jgi:hypothetical protein
VAELTALTGDLQRSTLTLLTGRGIAAQTR